MGSVGFGELLLIFVAALIAVGPDRLPSAARDIAKVIKNLRGIAHGLTTELRREVGLDEVSELFRKHGFDEVNPTLTISGTLPPLPPLPLPDAAQPPAASPSAPPTRPEV